MINYRLKILHYTHEIGVVNCAFTLLYLFINKDKVKINS